MYLASFYVPTLSVLIKTAKVITALIGTRTWSWRASLYYGMFSLWLSDVRLSNIIKCHPDTPPTPNLDSRTRLTKKHFELSPVAQSVSQTNTQSLYGPDSC